MGKTAWKYPYQSNEISLAAYSDGPISGAEIRLYQDGSFQYCSSGIGYTDFYTGTYHWRNDSIQLLCPDERPSLAATSLYRSDRYLEFWGPKDLQPYRFNLDSRFTRDSVIGPNFSE
ncbi:MAG: hypothetical protein AAF433_06935 [Bacteroidota bacterium]